MSGAEFIAVISLGASIIQVTDACHRLINRIIEYRGNSGFDDLTAQLRLLCCDLNAIKALNQREGLDSETESILAAVIQGCSIQVAKLEKLVETMLPRKDSPAFRRKLYAIKAFAMDHHVQQTIQQLDQYKRALTLHLTVRTYEKALLIPQISSRMEESTRQLQKELSETSSTSNTNSADKADSSDAFALERHSSRLAHPRVNAGVRIRRLCVCACHRSIFAMLLCRCNCAGQGFSGSIALLGKLITVDMGILSSKNSSHLTIRLSCVNTVKTTSPGFIVIWKLHLGCITEQQALCELRSLRGMGLIGYGDVTRGGRGYLELSLILQGKPQDPLLPATTISRNFVEKLITDGLAKSDSNESREKISSEVLQHGIFDSSVLDMRNFTAWKGFTLWDGNFLRDSGGNIGWDTFDLCGVLSLRQFVKLDRDFPGLSTLQSAVLASAATDVKELVSNGSPEMAEKNWRGQTAMHLTVCDTQILGLLLRHCSPEDLDVQDDDGLTPLMYATIHDCIGSALLLLEAGADTFCIDNANGLDMWMWAAVLGRLNFLAEALRFFKERWSTNLWEKTANRTVWICNVRSKCDYYERFSSQTDALTQLFDMGVDPCQLSRQGNSFLHLITDTLESEQLLRRIDCHINKGNGSGCTPLMALARLGKPGPIHMAIRSGANAHMVDQDDQSPLHYLIRSMGRMVLRNLQSQSEDFKGFMEIGGALLSHGVEILHSDSCSCPCSQGGCCPMKLLFNDAPHLVDAPESNLAAVTWAIEWYLLIRESQGWKISGQVVACWYRLQVFDELGMVHTCCSAKHSLIMAPLSLENSSLMRASETRPKVDAEDIRREADEIQEEQKGLRTLLEEDCDNFEMEQPLMEAQGLLYFLARRSVMMERSASEPPNSLDVLSNDPFWAVDHDKDSICTIPPITAEPNIETYMQMMEDGEPEYGELGLTNSNMNLERRRLCSLLLDEVARVRSLPAEEKDWQPNWPSWL